MAHHFLKPDIDQRAKAQRQRRREAGARAGSDAETVRDAAAFSRDALQAIYGDAPACFLCPIYRAQDPHHIYGRTIESSRILASSVLNAAMLSRDLHTHCPFLNNKYFQRVLVSHALRHVNLAISKGTYAMTAEDLAFLDWWQTQ